MKLLFIGDILGHAGREILVKTLPDLRARWALDFVIVNGENAAGGYGITEVLAQEFYDAGVDCITLGNHAWGQKEALVFIERQPGLLRPLNYPEGTPGRGAYLYRGRHGHQVLVMNVMGRIFMDPVLDDPFQAVARELALCPLGIGCDAIVIDMHAETTSEKTSLGYFVDGKASLVVGTHTHVPTADHRRLPQGTGYISDVGMTGCFDSIIGMEKDEPMRRFTTRISSGRYKPASGSATLCALAVEIDPATGLTSRLAPVRIGGLLEEVLPPFWG